jgi:hypothetical protein
MFIHCYAARTFVLSSFLISSVKLKREDRFTYSRLQSYLVTRGTEILAHGSQAATTAARQTASYFTRSNFFNFQDDFSQTLLFSC